MVQDFMSSISRTSVAVNQFYSCHIYYVPRGLTSYYTEFFLYIPIFRESFFLHIPILETFCRKNSAYPHNRSVLPKKFCISRRLLSFAEFTDMLRSVDYIFFSIPDSGFTLIDARFRLQRSSSIHLRRAAY